MAKHGLKPTDELVRLAIAGDGAAFTRLWDTYIEALRVYLKGLMRQFDDFYVDDVCSRSFEKAFRQISSFDPARGNFSTWLKAIAHNTALDIIDQEARAQKSYVRMDDAESGNSALENIGDEQVTPLESIIRTEDEVHTSRCIDGLPDIYRTVARMRLLDGLQYKEIAEETGLELNTVRTRIRRAKSMIEKMNADEGI